MPVNIINDFMPWRRRCTHVNECAAYVLLNFSSRCIIPMVVKSVEHRYSLLWWHQHGTVTYAIYVISCHVENYVQTLLEPLFSRKWHNDEPPFAQNHRVGIARCPCPLTTPLFIAFARILWHVYVRCNWEWWNVQWNEIDFAMIDAVSEQATLIL